VVVEGKEAFWHVTAVLHLRSVMQGFNKYYPPDYDPSQGSLNKYRGKHALGDRARKINQGILIVRFELPFNIWCGTCNNHIGMGVRYNAEKKKIGNYYSTPIYSFRCKCHLCDGWFEIQTDPKNTRYIVTSGARQKEESWDPAENGGFAVHDTDNKATSADPLAALEKSTEAQNHLATVQVPRLEALQQVSERFDADPYSHSLRVRKRFREEKKVEKEKRRADELLKGRYGLPASLTLLEDDDKAKHEARKEWEKGRRELQQRLNKGSARAGSPSKPLPFPSTNYHKSSLDSLRARVCNNTGRLS
jgi:coiled-coil domain-containing protein 130